MTLNFIWLFFIVAGFITALVNAFVLGNPDVFPKMVEGFIEMATAGFNIMLGLAGVMTLWCGIMRVG